MRSLNKGHHHVDHHEKWVAAPSAEDEEVHHHQPVKPPHPPSPCSPAGLPAERESSKEKHAVVASEPGSFTQTPKSASTLRLVTKPSQRQQTHRTRQFAELLSEKIVACCNESPSLSNPCTPRTTPRTHTAGKSGKGKDEDETTSQTPDTKITSFGDASFGDATVKDSKDSAPLANPIDESNGTSKPFVAVNAATHHSLEDRTQRVSDLRRRLKRDLALEDVDESAAWDEGMSLFGVPSSPISGSDIRQSTRSKRFPTLREIADSRFTTVVVFCTVGLNAIQMGVQADHSSGMLEVLFLSFDHCFTAIFALEMLVKVAGYRREYFRDYWNLFDFLLTWLSIIDLWVLGALGAQSGLKIISVLRILRVFRVVRLLRMVHSLRELAMIVEGLMKATGTTSWAVLLLVLILYILSIFCVEVCGQEGTYAGWDPNNTEYEEVTTFNSYQYFGTIPRAMFTLLQVALLADDWFVVSRALLEKQPFILVVLILFVAFTTFGIINVIMGLVLENVMESAKSIGDHEAKEKKRAVLDSLSALYEFAFSLDRNKDGRIDLQELQKAWELDQMKHLMSLIEFPIGWDNEELRTILDRDGDKFLSIEELIISLVRLTLSTDKQIIFDLKSQVNRVNCEVKSLTNEVSNIHSRIMEDVKNEVRATVQVEMSEIKTLLQKVAGNADPILLS